MAPPDFLARFCFPAPRPGFTPVNFPPSFPARERMF
jgi:hypothetical protein